MATIIQQQNAGIQKAARDYPRRQAKTNRELARILAIAEPPAEYNQDYIQSNIRVRVI